MSYAGWLTTVVTIGAFVAMIFNAPADLLFVAAAVAFVIAGVITPQEALSGFSNPAVITVGALFIVASALRETGALDQMGQRLLGGVRTEKGAFVRLAGVLMSTSAFMNNTPIVAMFTPMVLDWCRRNRVSPSKLLIPVSYLTILGGTCTLIGTSTNLVVQGLVIKEHDRITAELAKDPAADTPAMQKQLAGVAPLGFFELSVVGIPFALIGAVYLYTIGRRLLPERKELLEQLGESRREYLAEIEVQPDCGLIGQSVQAAGLRHLPGLFLIEIDRQGATVAPVTPEEVIQPKDRLIFTGVVSSIVELERIPGLVHAADPTYEVAPRSQVKRMMCEAVISDASPLIGKTVRDADFRARYNAAIVAVHRGGQRVTNKIGDIRLRSGDTLLLQTRPHFTRAHRNSRDFHLVSNVDDYRPLRRHRLWIALALFAGLVTCMTLELIPTEISSLLFAVLMIASGCLSTGEAHRSIEWQVLLTVAASFATGAALQKSGAAAAIAGMLVEATQSAGPYVTLAALYLMGVLASELLSNNAAAVLMFPFGIEVARQMGVSPRPFIMAIVFSASACFATPIGYQTHMMVYGPGGYQFNDFMRVGLPLDFVLAAAATILIPMFFPF
ncbi:MAG: SLC13 family permease [Planctomycetaceae bacterium]